MCAEILVTREASVATVTLSNPPKLNALTVAMWHELARVFDRLSADDDLRCVVLRGAGNEAFAAGADIAEFATARNTVEQGKTYHRELVYGALRAVAECRHPTVAVIYGACAGGGLELACQCDLRLAGRSARFGVPINRLGFSIAWDELDALLPLIGRAAALEILVEGRMWGAQEAYDKGLLTRLVDDDALAAETVATLGRICDGAPLVARWHKQFIRRLTPRPEALTPAERDANFDYFHTEDYRIGYEAFMHKRRPRFLGR
jgi:enoyl-CoA hydratase/carnithine racemase